MAPTYGPTNELATQHKNTEHLAINDTYIHRILTYLAVRTLGKFHSLKGQWCIPITKHKIVKSGLWVNLTEAATMRYIAENTSIPVPKVLCAFVRKGKNRAYIVMEKIRGNPLPAVWGTLSEDSRDKVYSQLKLMLQELRSLQPPSDVWCTKLRRWIPTRLSHSKVISTYGSVQIGAGISFLAEGIFESIGG